MVWRGPIPEEFSKKGLGIKHAEETHMASFLALFVSVFEGWATDTEASDVKTGSAPKAAWNPEQNRVICVNRCLPSVSRAGRHHFGPEDNEGPGGC